MQHAHQRKMTNHNEQHTKQRHATQIDARHKIRGVGGRGGSLSIVGVGVGVVVGVVVVGVVVVAVVVVVGGSKSQP